MSRKPKLLLVAENVTLAQVVRLASLGFALDTDKYEVHFACSRFDELVFADKPFVLHPLWTVSKEHVFKAMKAGKRIYEQKTIRRYVEDELRLLDATRPDLIVGDFRLSLPISAELKHIPCATLINAYWSPFAIRQKIPVPDHPIVKLLGESMTERYFPMAVPKVFAQFAAPINAVRRQYGLPESGSLLQTLTHADYTLYPDEPSLVPVENAPEHHVFIGPVLWSPNVPVPDIDVGGRPLVYVTLGSSGDVDALPLVIEALASLKLAAVIATAGRVSVPRLPEHIYAFDFVAGEVLAARADIVVTNGGSSTGYQALAAGTPCLGLPSNLDQYLCMQAMTQAGAALEVKARTASVANIRLALQRLLNETEFRDRARSLGKRFARMDAGKQFEMWIDAALARSSQRAAE